jgi:hypothetical protein
MGEIESAPDKVIIGPQPGPQTAFFASAADIAIYGGTAGGGETFAELLECSRHVHVPGFGAVIFRRTTPQIRNEGGLWDESLTAVSARLVPNHRRDTGGDVLRPRLGFGGYAENGKQ